MKTMVNVEELLHRKLEETKATDEDFDIWTNYWNLVEKLIEHKKYANEKSNEYNKKNKEWHRISNNIYNNKKIGNLEKVAYWEQKLKEYKESERNGKN